MARPVMFTCVYISTCRAYPMMTRGTWIVRVSVPASSKWVA